MLYTGCAQQDVTGSYDSIQYYFNKARWGDGDAYLKLAQIYRDGIIVKPDYLHIIQMGMMAEEYMAIQSIDDLFKDLSDDNEIKTTHNAIKMLEKMANNANIDSLRSIAENMVERGISDGYFVQAAIAYKNKETDYAETMFNRGIENGSILAELGKIILMNGADHNPEALVIIADRIPITYQIIGNYYAGIPNDSITDIPLAAKYYRKAEENACLGRNGARWMLEAIYTKRVLPIDSMEIKKLWSLGRNQINDSIIWLP
jgi:TPR repeat protein